MLLSLLPFVWISVDASGRAIVSLLCVTLEYRYYAMVALYLLCSLKVLAHSCEAACSLVLTTPCS